MTEAWLLTSELLKDSSSHVHAAVAGWTRPMSAEALVLADLVDLTAVVHAEPKQRKNLRPYPRPFGNHSSDDGAEAERGKRRLGRTTRPPSEVEAALAGRGHHRTENR